jgi:hypothetical protein
MVMVWVPPICVQFTPSLEIYPVKLFPVRTSLTQYGSAEMLLVAEEVLPPVLVRAYKYMEFPGNGSYATKACAEPAVSVSRIMTPASGYVLPWTLSTRATIEPSPFNG